MAPPTEKQIVIVSMLQRFAQVRGSMPSMESVRNVPMVKSATPNRQVASGVIAEQFVAVLMEKQIVIVSMLQRFAQVRGSMPSMESFRNDLMVKSVTPNRLGVPGALMVQSVVMRMDRQKMGVLMHLLHALVLGSTLNMESVSYVLTGRTLILAKQVVNGALMEVSRVLAPGFRIHHAQVFVKNLSTLNTANVIDVLMDKSVDLEVLVANGVQMDLCAPQLLIVLI